MISGKFYPTYRLGDVLEAIIGGGTPSRSNKSYYSGSVPWATVKDFHGGKYLTDTEEHITNEAIANSATHVIPRNTVILVTRMAVGSAMITRVPTAINQDIKALYAAKRLDPEYLYYWTQAVKSQIEAMATGTTVKGIRLESLLAMEIPFPPLPEQRRIAEILGSADALLMHLSHANNRLRSISTSLLDLHITQSHFGRSSELGHLPKSWDIAELGSLTESVTDGPFGSNLKTKDYTHSGVRVIRLQNIGRGLFLDSDKAYIDYGKFESLSKYSVRKGDLLVGALGDPVGRACLYTLDEPAIVKADCFRVRTNVSVDPWFLALYLNSSMARPVVTSAVHGVTRQRINLQGFRSLLCPVPPISEQRRLAQVYALLMRQIDINISSMVKVSSVKTSLLENLIKRQEVSHDMV